MPAAAGGAPTRLTAVAAIGGVTGTFNHYYNQISSSVNYHE